MTTDRRTFLQSVAGGAAGLSLAAQAGSATAQAASGRPKSIRKMIIRADDIGQSKVCNIGTFEAIDYGLITSCDIMLDSPGTVDALERLRAYPWLSIGWHMHMWGAPVSDANLVPSLVEKSGPFVGRFRENIAQQQDVVFEEALRELRAQLQRCVKILGRVPDTSGGGNTTTPWGRAVRQIADEFGMAYNFADSRPTPPHYQKKINDAQKAGEGWSKFYPATANPGAKADPKWASRKIVGLAGTSAFIDLLTDSISSVENNYDPVKFYTEDRSGILKEPTDVVSWQAWHPGYVDYYVYRTGERVARPRAQQFVVGRTQDVAAMTSPVLRAWIKQNGIELISFRDALYGTRDIQNHLAAVGSDLAFA
jgi:predicted glycoside hydrolase/deacetylase ChbG (UPF0249 family)